MSRLDFPRAAFNEIRRSRGVKDALTDIAVDIAREAGQRAGDSEGYGNDLTVGTDRARAHVWARSGKAIHAERKDAVLLQIVAERGGGR